jgi:hypothetical protein
MTTAKPDFIQDHMNAAYARWQQDDNDWDYEDFLEQCSKVERACVIVGNMNYQVENGGWGQWDGNGYSVTLGELKNLFEDMPESELTKKMIRMLESVEDSLPTDDFRNGYCQCDFEEGEDGEDELVGDECDQCAGQPDDYTLRKESDKYYEFNEALLMEVDEYLKGKYAI